MAIEIEGDVAKVWETIGVTLNMGDYNSVKLDYGHMRTCTNTQEDIAKTSAIVHKWNERIIEQRIKKYVALYEDLQK